MTKSLGLFSNFDPPLSSQYIDQSDADISLQEKKKKIEKKRKKFVQPAALLITLQSMFICLVGGRCSWLVTQSQTDSLPLSTSPHNLRDLIHSAIQLTSDLHRLAPTHTPIRHATLTRHTIVHISPRLEEASFDFNSRLSINTFFDSSFSSRTHTTPHHTTPHHTTPHHTTPHHTTPHHTTPHYCFALVYRLLLIPIICFIEIILSTSITSIVHP